MHVHTTLHTCNVNARGFDSFCSAQKKKKNKTKNKQTNKQTETLTVWLSLSVCVYIYIYINDSRQESGGIVFFIRFNGHEHGRLWKRGHGSAGAAKW